MPRYELALIMKAMQRPETAATLKCTVEALMEKGAVVRNLENLGQRQLLYRMYKHDEHHYRGGYFLVDFESPRTVVSTMMEQLGRDIDIIRSTIVKHDAAKPEECMGIIAVNEAQRLLAEKNINKKNRVEKM